MHTAIYERQDGRPHQCLSPMIDGYCVHALERDSDGMLPASVWPGGYPLYYVTEADGLQICPDCANKTDTSDPAEYAGIHYEGQPIVCEDCGAAIESAYGDPDEDEE